MKSNYSISVLLIVLVLKSVPCISQSTKNPEFSKGVSIELAKQRKKTISNINYNLEINIPIEKTNPVSGNLAIVFNLSDNTKPVIIDFKGNKDQLETVDVNGGNTVLTFQNEHIIIKNKLKKGNNKILIKFKAGNESLTRQPEFIYTFFVPDRARTFFPCFDQPDLKATLSLTATVPSGWTAVSNGKEITRTVSEKSSTIVFSKSDKISTYLFSIVAGKFQKATRILDNREVNFYYRETNQEKIDQSLDTIFQIHQKALHFLEYYTGIPYPFKKIDFIAIPSFQAGGMEHVGITDYKEETLFLDKTANQTQKLDRIHLISHEIAHTWFGNLVTMKWFNDVWMKEVFANLMADKIINDITGKNDDLKFLLMHYPQAYYEDRTQGNHPIRQQLGNLNQASLMYGSIIYQKAPIVMNQLEKYIGNDKFREGLRIYLKKFENKNADWNDLISIWISLSKNNITEWNKNWINKAGRPVFNYSLNEKNGIITSFKITQKAEHPKDALGSQNFSVALVYDDNIKILPVNVNSTDTSVLDAIGEKVPLYFLFNVTADGYGCFPVDKKMFLDWDKLKNPVMRAVAYLNIYENVLNNTGIKPTEFITLYQKNFKTEGEDLIIERMKRQYKNIYWQFLTPAQRDSIAPIAEKEIWDVVQKADTDAKKRSLYQLYSSIAISSEAVHKLYTFWNTSTGPVGVKLNEDDIIALASELALRNHPETNTILKTQSERITNSDKKAKFNYLSTPLSNDTKIRDDYFASLIMNRSHDDWIPTALSYLHHPLRLDFSEKYLMKTLELLEEFQKTGSVFFATDCLRETFNYYQSKSAKSIVEQFLLNQPDYNKGLKNKILQETDDLFRTEKIIAHEKNSE